MGNEYFLNYEGADRAATRFGRRATDLMGASATVLPPELCMADNALEQAAELVRAFSGRMLAYGDELSVLSGLVKDVVKVTNDVEVDLTLAP